MTPATDFETWITAATRGLGSDGAERIRTEIGEHYHFTVASGATAEQAIAALGNPKQANLDYRKVFLTESEAILASTFTRPKRNLRSGLIAFAILAAWTWFVARKHPPQNANMWATWALVWIDAPLRIFYLPNTTQRARRYLIGDCLRAAILAVLFTGDVGPFGAGLTLGLAPIIYLDYKRWNIFRKLAGKAAPAFPRLLPGHPSLTLNEAAFLQGMRRDQKNAFPHGAIPLFLMLAVGTYYQPAIVGCLTAIMALRFLVPYAVDVYTPMRSHWLRIAKNTLLAFAVIVPLLYQVLVPMPADVQAKAIRGGIFGGVIACVLFFGVMERVKNSLRRKLPVAEWPKDLYL